MALAELPCYSLLVICCQVLSFSTVFSVTQHIFIQHHLWLGLSCLRGQEGMPAPHSTSKRKKKKGSKRGQ
jgi:hypothetical protein